MTHEDALSPLQDVIIHEREDITTPAGAIYHILREDDADLWAGVAEVYASVTSPGIIKGWHQHEIQTSVITCVAGEALLVIHDPRSGSSTRGKSIEVPLVSGKRRTVRIPPGLIYGWKNTGKTPAILINCPSHVHDAAKSRKLPLDTAEVPYRWA